MRRSDVDYLLHCYRLAGRSPDPSTQNAAILVSQNGEVVASAVNEFPRGVEMTFERGENKLVFTEHAERNAIYCAARYGISTNGLMMVAAWAACAECARAIIQSGISKMVAHQLPGAVHSTWDASIAAGMEMLHEAGVEVVVITEKLDLLNRVRVRRKGVEVFP